MKLLLTPWQTRAFTPWHLVGLFLVLALITTKTQAIIPFVWGAIAAASTIFGWNLFGGSSDAESVDTNLVDGSIGGDLFTKIYTGFNNWLVGSEGNDGIYELFADAVLPLLISAFLLMIILYGASMFFSKWTDRAIKMIKTMVIVALAIAFIDNFDLFNYFFLDTLLDILKGTLNILLQTPNAMIAITDDAKFLSSSVFGGVDFFFKEVFEAIKGYEDDLEKAKSILSFEIEKKIALLLLILTFSALYAIFFILIVVGFFGFFLMMGFAPVFMAIGTFHKPTFFAWLKTTLNYFLIPIFTAAVMSMTIPFLSDAVTAIGKLPVNGSVWTAELGTAFLIAIFSIGLHWKAPEFAAGITGGMASGAGSIVATAGAVGAGAWGLSRQVGAAGAGAAGYGSGQSAGNRMGASVRQSLAERYSKGGKK